MDFKLALGYSAENLEGIHPAYSSEENRISAVLSEEQISPVVNELIKLLPEPVFFFIELPCSADEEKSLRKTKADPLHCKVYYLDNCTAQVAEAIMKRYGQLLIADGLVKFGFGSHKSGDEIYCLKYNEMIVFGGEKYAEVFDKMNIPREEEFKSVWDNFTNDTPGECRAVEIDGETVYDIPENLKSEGMYYAETREN